MEDVSISCSSGKINYRAVLNVHHYQRQRVLAEVLINRIETLINAFEKTTRSNKYILELYMHIFLVLITSKFSAIINNIFILCLDIVLLKLYRRGRSKFKEPS